MNYRHIYHAGNFADVYKHWILTLLLTRFVSKDRPFAVLDTHAGLGLYDLNSMEADKTREYQQGITKLLKQSNIPESFQILCTQVKMLNTLDILQYYPGSPRIIEKFLRPQDELHVCELHPEDYQRLKANFRHTQQVHVHHRDAYEALKALLPFKQSRGLILIDPPYEISHEFSQIANALAACYPKFAHGTYAIWYPIKSYSTISTFYQKMKQYIPQEMLACEFVIQNPINPDLLNGCGMLIINPPWQLDKAIETDAGFLLECFAKDKKAYAKTTFL